MREVREEPSHRVLWAGARSGGPALIARAGRAVNFIRIAIERS